MNHNLWSYPTLYLIEYFSGYAVVLPTQPAGRNPCVAVSELAAEYERFINHFLTSDDVCPAKRRSAVSIKFFRFN